MTNSPEAQPQGVELLPCLRCKGTEFRVLGGGMNFWTVTCKCGLSSALQPTRERAVEWWNFRADPATVTEQDQAVAEGITYSFQDLLGFAARVDLSNRIAYAITAARADLPRATATEAPARLAQIKDRYSNRADESATYRVSANDLAWLINEVELRAPRATADSEALRHVDDITQQLNDGAFEAINAQCAVMWLLSAIEDLQSIAPRATGETTVEAALAGWMPIETAPRDGTDLSNKLQCQVLKERLAERGR